MNLCCYRNQRFRTATRTLKYMFATSWLSAVAAHENFVLVTYIISHNHYIT